jgi:prepilin-type N-terminal cleavage/methylation domain-containing protein/prepilin-type processing-associated H-X9-DG protein
MPVDARRTYRRGFTLIELLVVVAIIALLISILMPSLRLAREKANTLKCLANLKDTGNAMSMYFVDAREWFPFEKRNWPKPGFPAPLHAFYYGGHPGRPLPEAEPWWGYQMPKFRDTPAGRPFNNYLYSNLSSKRDRPADMGSAWFEQRRDMPVFHCPSDLGGFWNTQEDNENAIYPTYYTTGSSYDCNYHFVWRWAAGPGAPYRDLYLEVANHFLLKQREQHSSIFVILFEDPFDSAQWRHQSRIGWHKQLNTHNFLFLDGHAANTYADTTNKGIRGPGWKTAARWWWTDPHDPDYEYRDLGPR